jgi:phosphinothricin acetyltransferase
MSVLEHVRPAAWADLEALNEIYNHYVRSSHVTFDVDVRGLEWRQRWFSDHDEVQHPILVAERAGRVTGFAAAGEHRPKAAYASTLETSVYVAPDEMGRGIGSALYAALVGILDEVGVHRSVAGIAQPNAASVRLHERFGFHRVARFTEIGWKLGRYWDVDWYERPGRHPRV